MEKDGDLERCGMAMLCRRTRSGSLVADTSLTWRWLYRRETHRIHSEIIESHYCSEVAAIYHVHLKDVNFRWCLYEMRRVIGIGGGRAKLVHNRDSIKDTFAKFTATSNAHSMP